MWRRFDIRIQGGGGGQQESSEGIEITGEPRPPNNTHLEGEHFALLAESGAGPQRFA